MFKDGKLKFKNLDRPAEVEDPLRTNVEMTRQEKETQNEVNFGKIAPHLNTRFEILSMREN